MMPRGIYKRTAKHLALLRSPSRCRKIGRAARRIRLKDWQDPVVRANRIAGLKRGWSKLSPKEREERLNKTTRSPKVRAIVSKAGKARAKDPEYRAARKKTTTDSWQVKEIREARIEGCKNAWKDPVQRARRIAGILKAARTETTQPEFKMMKILKELGIKFIYEKVVAGFVPDFFLPEYGLVIECDGVYWHLKPEVAQRDKRRNKAYKKEGFRLQIFTDIEIMKTPEKVLNKLVRLLDL